MSSVSVVIPTHDREARLKTAVESVLAQTQAPREIVVVDDGSTDGTREMLAREFPQVRYLYQENRGVAAARNLGIRESRGTWLAFLDSDDLWLPGKLERQWEAIARSPGARLCHTNEVWIRRGARVNPMRKHDKSGGFIFRKCLQLCVISPSSVLLHREVLETTGDFDESFPACEDYDLWLRVTARYPVHYLDEPLVVKHGGHADQLSRRYVGMDRFRIRALEKILAEDVLSAEDREAALRVLLEKIEIYRNGAEKRGRSEEARLYAQKKEAWLSCSVS